MSNKKVIFIILTVISGLLTVFLISKNMITFAIVLGTIAIISLFLFITELFTNRNPEEKYNTFIKDIMKSFDAVLVKTDELPEIDNRSLVIVTDFEDLIDAQIEIRKPIYYKRADRSILFVLLDDKQACICLVKVSDDEKSEFDTYIEEQKNKKEKFDQSLFADIENTTIVKLDNNKSYRVSPIRNEKSKLKNKREVKEVLDGLPKLKDTMDLSKTDVFRELNRR